MSSHSLDELSVFRRTSALAQEAVDLIKARLREDPAFVCQVEQVSFETVIRQVWSACYKRAIQEALEQDGDATRH